MQTKRAMILVSIDAESIRLGATELIQQLTEALVAYDLQGEVEISTLSNVGISNILPLVVVYPEATVYGPVKAEDARFLVEEHLYKGRIANDLLAPPKQLSGNIGWLRAYRGAAVPASPPVVNGSSSAWRRVRRNTSFVMPTKASLARSRTASSSKAIHIRSWKRWRSPVTLLVPMKATFTSAANMGLPIAACSTRSNRRRN